jgi:hypothetical protein
MLFVVGSGEFSAEKIWKNMMQSAEKRIQKDSRAKDIISLFGLQSEPRKLFGYC